MTDNPGSSFSSGNDFNLASWFVQSKVAKLQIDVYFTEGFGGTDRRSFRSSYPLQHLDILNLFCEYFVWVEASIDDGRHATTFYYRNIIDCIHYLTRQVGYSSAMIYAPIRE